MLAKRIFSYLSLKSLIPNQQLSLHRMENQMDTEYNKKSSTNIYKNFR